MHYILNGSPELPAVIGGVIVMGRDENLEPVDFGGLNDPLYVLDGLVLFDAVADEFPGDTLLTQKIVLRVGDHYRRIFLVDFHGFSPLLHE